MKYSLLFITAFLILLSTSFFAAEPAKDRTLDQLAKTIVKAIKADDYAKFEACWAKPEAVVAHAKSVATDEELKKLPPNFQEYFESSRKAIKPFYQELQKNIIDFGLDKKNIEYKSMECILGHDDQHGYSINFMKIRFFFSTNPEKVYSITIDDAFCFDSKNWAFTDKPLSNIKK